jgi:hypothetical protein
MDLPSSKKLYHLQQPIFRITILFSYRIGSNDTSSVSSDSEHGSINIWASSVESLSRNVSPSPADQAAPSGFMKLPLEIRRLVYRSAMEESPEKYEITGRHPRKRSRHHPRQYLRERPSLQPLSLELLRNNVLQSLSFTNRTILYESMLVFLERTQIVLIGAVLNAQECLSTFLSTFPQNQGFAAVRSICYGTSNHRSHEYDLRLLNKLPGLQRLVIGFHVWSLHRSFTGRHWYNKQELMARFELGPIFRLKKLKELRIRCYESLSAQRYPPGREPFENSTALFKEKKEDCDNEVVLWSEFVLIGRAVMDDRPILNFREVCRL